MMITLLSSPLNFLAVVEKTLELFLVLEMVMPSILFIPFMIDFSSETNDRIVISLSL